MDEQEDISPAQALALKEATHALEAYRLAPNEAARNWASFLLLGAVIRLRQAGRRD